MTAEADRYHRNILLFGEEGQRRLRATCVVIAGVGGLGSPLAQHLALLGVKRVVLIDSEELDETNRNRFIGARSEDAVPGSPKVQLVDRLIKEINPDVESIPLQISVISQDAFDAVKAADWVFGCFDDDGPRAVLNELCAAFEKPYIDLASDVPEAGIYGGRVCVAFGGNGCLDCLDQLDRRQVRRYFQSDEQRDQEDAIYGIAKEALAQKGPSVSPLNGVIASLAAVEFMAAVTGLRAPARLQIFQGWTSKVVVSSDKPRAGCTQCNGVWGTGVAADVERYLR